MCAGRVVRVLLASLHTVRNSCEPLRRHIKVRQKNRVPHRLSVVCAVLCCVFWDFLRETDTISGPAGGRRRAYISVCVICLGGDGHTDAQLSAKPRGQSNRKKVRASREQRSPKAAPLHTLNHCSSVIERGGK